MSGSNRGLYVAIGIALAISALIAAIVWPSRPPLKTFHYEQARNEHYTAGGPSCEPKALATLGNGRRALRKAQACAEQAETERLQTNDLIQQTRAANAAEAQAEMAYQAGWNGLIASVAGFLTLCAAVGAALYARDAAREGGRSADAFLTVETARLKVSVADGYEIRDHRLYYPFQISNMGRTAATVTTLRIWMNSFPHFKGDNGTISVGQGMIIKADSVVPVPDCWTHVNHAGPGHAPPFPYLSGYLEYETVFGETVTTYFSYLINNDLSLEINKADGWPAGDKIERKKEPEKKRHAK